MWKPADNVERLNIDRLTSKCGKSGRFSNRILGLDPAKTTVYLPVSEIHTIIHLLNYVN